MAEVKTANIAPKKAAEKAKGKDYMAWFLVGASQSAPTLLEGQSANSESMDNATQTVAPLKTDAPGSNERPAYQGRIDGIRDLTGSVSFARLKDASESAVQIALINKLRHSADTTTTMFFGRVDHAKVGEVLTPKFTGYKTEVLIKGGSTEYPAESEVSGTVNWENKGGEPIEIADKMWAEAIAQKENEPIA